MASAERQPITGFWGGAPSGGQGAKTPEADEVFVFKTVIFNGFAAVVHGIMHNVYF